MRAFTIGALGLAALALLARCGATDVCHVDSDCATPHVCIANVCQSPGLIDAGLPADAGQHDSGMADSGRPDSGSPDSGPPDAGPVRMNWTQESPATTPTACQSESMAYDSSRGVTVLFGGLNNTSGAPLSETWEWDGAHWTQMSPVTRPQGRIFAAMSYDSARGVTVLFGGDDGDGNIFQDTWEWDGVTWTRMSPVTSPPARETHVLAFDSSRNVTVLFSGVDSSGNFRNTLADTWTWNGTDWTQNMPPASPPGRAFASMTFDSVRGVCVLFGGYVQLEPVNDTWEWNGSTWTQVAPVPAPSIRTWSGMAFDEARGVSVIFGGADNSQAFSDTWTFDGTQYTQQMPATPPPARSPGGGMVYDSGHQRVVMYGGANGASGDGVGLTDIWEWGPAH
jgi:hypothetical protein